MRVLLSVADCQRPAIRRETVFRRERSRNTHAGRPIHGFTRSKAPTRGAQSTLSTTIAPTPHRRPQTWARLVAGRREARRRMPIAARSGRYCRANNDRPQRSVSRGNRRPLVHAGLRLGDFDSLGEESNPVTIRTFSVLAGAYRARRSLALTLTHACETDSSGYPVHVLCQRVFIDSICPDFATEETPTCAICARKMRAKAP
jgi:hypothetical protein